jgi:protein TonB
MYVFYTCQLNVYDRGDTILLLRYTVTRSGAVRDVRVLESTHHVFEQPAIDAANRFKYKPRVVDGEAIDVENVTRVIRFELSP